MQIVICDDDSLCCEEITTLMENYMRENADFPYRIFSFSSGREMLNHIDEYGGFDLYILDVIMPEISGIEVASLLRNRGDRGIIIYLTASPDFAVDSYRVEAFYYLLKPVDKVQLFSVLDKAVSHIFNAEKKVFAIRTRESMSIFPIQNLLYAERTGRCICYHMNDGTTFNGVTFNGKFRNMVASLLAHEDFILVGSSFVVNLYHVVEISRTELRLPGGHCIPIPRRMYEKIKSKWASYWLNGGGYIL